jgi:hypothetical protein
MRIASLAAGLALAAIAIGVVESCSKSPAAPANGAQRLEIVGPTSVAPGDTRQFTALLHAPDSLARNVTTDVAWQSRADQIFSVSSTGEVAGIRSGDGSLTAFYRPDSSITASREVIVVPTGTYRLAGLVTEADSPNVPIPDAQLDLVAGSGAGLSTTTGTDGRYRLHGVAGDAQIRISKKGYDLSIDRITIQDHAMENFQLTLSRGRMEVGGEYQLTIAAADSCGPELPDEARRRVYTAVVVQQGRQLEVALGGATFATSKAGKGNRFLGTAEADHVKFTLYQEPFYSYYPSVPRHYPDVVEQLTSGFLTIAGTAVLKRSSRGLSGPLGGTLEFSQHDPRLGSSPFTARWCGSESHHLVLTR